VDLEVTAQVWMGPGKHFVHYFVQRKRLLNFVAIIEKDSWTRESWTDRGEVADALAAFEGWHPQVRILSAVDETFPSAGRARSIAPSTFLVSYQARRIPPTAGRRHVITVSNPHRVETTSLRTEVVRKPGEMLNPGSSWGEHLACSRWILAVLLEQLDLYRTPLPDGRRLIQEGRFAAVRQFIQLDVRDTEKWPCPDRVMTHRRAAASMSSTIQHIWTIGWGALLFIKRAFKPFKAALPSASVTQFAPPRARRSTHPTLTAKPPYRGNPQNIRPARETHAYDPSGGVASSAAVSMLVATGGKIPRLT
jgi:hypothetical protein